MLFSALSRHGVALFLWFNLWTDRLYSFTPIFSDQGRCCQSPHSCAISDCGPLDVECCRFTSCNETASAVYEGTFSIAYGNQSDNLVVYIRAHPTYIHIEYTMPSDDIAVALSWSDYDHPSPDLHFSLFASDLHDDGQWSLMEVVAEHGAYSMFTQNLSNPSLISGEYPCPSDSGYCLSSRILGFDHQRDYEQFNFVCAHTPYFSFLCP